MPARPLQTDAFVLLKRPPTDRFQGFTVFSASHGLLPIQQRLPKKPAAATTKTATSQTALDLFDEVSLHLESANQGGSWFVREARVIARHADIGRRYDRLRFASALARLIARNPVSEESRTKIAALLRSAFAAFAATTRPDIVYFKSLYLFARDEGYPVKQEWIETLPATLRTTAAHLLRTPMSALDDTKTPADETAVVLDHLERYLTGRAEIILE